MDLPTSLRSASCSLFCSARPSVRASSRRLTLSSLCELPAMLASLAPSLRPRLASLYRYQELTRRSAMTMLHFASPTPAPPPPPEHCFLRPSFLRLITVARNILNRSEIKFFSNNISVLNISPNQAAIFSPTMQVCRHTCHL